MSIAADRLKTEMPMRMRTLEKDKRGYPIPFIVFRPPGGPPMFPVSNHSLVADCGKKKLCGICGKRLAGSGWFVGGHRNFASPEGGFTDPPMHQDCAIYALTVCPYLAAMSYAKRTGDRLEAAAGGPGHVLVAEPWVGDERPVLFALGEAEAFVMHCSGPGRLVFQVENWRFVEYWHWGKRVNAPPADLRTP